MTAASRADGLIAVLGLGVTVLAGSAILLWESPSAPLLVLAAGVGGIGCLLLLPRPHLTCSLAALMCLWPYGLEPPPLDLVFTVAVNGLLWLALASSLLDSARRRRGVELGATGAAFLLYIGWAAITATWAGDLVEARKALVGNANGLMLFMVLRNQVRSAPALDGMMFILRAIGWAMVLCGLYAVAASGFQFGTRLKVFAMNENEYGLILIAMMPGVIWPVLRHRGARRMLDGSLALAFLLCSLGLIALTGSRGSSMALVFLLGALLLSRDTRAWGGIGLLLLLGLVACMPSLVSALIERFVTAEGGAFGARDVLWQAAMALFSDAPWTGVGVGNGPARLHNYIASLTNEFNRRSNLPAHNSFLEVAVETGILGLALYGTAIASGLAGLARVRDGSGFVALMRATALGYFVAWFKGGGVEYHPTLFLILALLTLPAAALPAPAEAGPARRGHAARMNSRSSADRMPVPTITT